MSRLLPAVLVMLAATAIATAQDSAKTDGKSLLEQYQEARGEFLKHRQVVRSRVEAARLTQEWQEKAADFSGRFLKFVEKNPKDPTVVELLFTVVENGLEFEGNREATAQALTVLQRNHLASEELAGYLPMLAHAADPAAEALLRAVQEKHAKGETRAMADFSLADCLLRTARRAKLLRDTPEEKRSAIEEAWGKEAVARYRATDPEKVNREAEELLELVEKKYDDIVVRTEAGRTTLAKLAGNRLYEVRHLSVGRTAPELATEDVGGKKVKLSDLRGKVVVLKFWATWCGPCRALIPHERKLVERTEGKPLVLISVNMDEEKSSLERFLEREKMPWAQWWANPEGEIATAWRINAFPSIYVLDGKGVIRYKDVREAELDEAVNKLLEEKTGEEASSPKQ